MLCRDFSSNQGLGAAMSDEQPETPANDEVDTEPEAQLSNTDRILVRLSFWQTILSVVGVFIAVVALYAALTESEAVRRQTAAAVWPFVQLSVADYDTGEVAGFTLSLTNAGVGPALVRSLRLIVDGEPMRDWEQVIAHLDGTIDEHVGRNSIGDRVLSPGHKVDLISVTDPMLARRLQAVVRSSETSLTYCYCSIFAECWLMNSQSQALDPEPTEACPSFGNQAFLN
tara:strand:+ start:6084 stop:6767 length:684 start_codon:yes stop_codon:yes gene_type:complete